MVEDYQEPISQLKENILSVWEKLDVDDINRKIAEKEELVYSLCNKLGYDNSIV